jgi:hypothetical protein
MGDAEKSLDFGEIVEKFPALVAIFLTAQAKVKEAQMDGKLTGAELGGVMAVVAVPMGELVDQLIADAND